MTKSLGYYTSYTPGDGSLLEHLQKEYGAYLERMNGEERGWLTSAIAVNLHSESKCPSAKLSNLTERILNELPLTEQQGVLQALISYTREVPSSD